MSGTDKRLTATPAANGRHSRWEGEQREIVHYDEGQDIGDFPMLKSEGLVGALVYYDGQHNDSSMNVVLIMIAVKQGAIIANYCEVTDLHKDASGKLTGAIVKDGLSGKE
ncbi:hypothetical protein BDQ17DRAFT_1432242 [Cyathus striatus]|nr:hypothetical protein BDQ17DRAFT_1432242 [Cyathus striatus]